MNIKILDLYLKFCNYYKVEASFEGLKYYKTIFNL